MGSSTSSGMSDEAEAETDRIMLSKLNSVIAKQELERYRLKCERNEVNNKYNEIRCKHVQMKKENEILKTQVQRLQNGIRMGDMRCSDLLKQIDTLQRENKQKNQRVVHLTSINCTFEQQIEAYRKKIGELKTSIDFSNKCLQEQEKVRVLK